MSLKSRARRLSKSLKLPHQATLETLRAASQEINQLVERGWDRERAETYKVDPDLDGEYRDVSRTARYVSENECENCGQTYFEGRDKKGMEVSGHPQFCPSCIESYDVWTCDEGNHDILGEPTGMPICDSCFRDKMNRDNT